MIQKYTRVFKRIVVTVTLGDCGAVGKGVFFLYYKIPFLFSNEKNGNDDKLNIAILNTVNMFHITTNRIGFYV